MYPYRTNFRATQAAANNALAQGQQAGAGRSAAGAGLARGKGQQAADAYRADMARAQGMGAAADIRQQDMSLNRDMNMQANMMRRSQQQSYDAMDEQFRQSQWDSRFNNLTTAWGALAGLLR